MKLKVSSIAAFLLVLWVLVGMAVGLAFLGEVSRRFPLFVPSVLLFSLVAFFLILAQNDWDRMEVIRTCRVLCVASILTSIIILYGYSRHKVAIERMFLRGKTRNENITYDNDDGEATGTWYWIETDNATGKEVLDWAYLLLVIGGPVLTVYIYYKRFSKEEDF